MYLQKVISRKTFLAWRTFFGESLLELVAHGDDPVRHGLHVHQPLSPATASVYFLKRTMFRIRIRIFLGLLDPLYGSGFRHGLHVHQPLSPATGSVYFLKRTQCSGSGCFLASWIRIRTRYLFVRIRIQILPTISKKMKKNLDLHCFVVSSLWFLSLRRMM